MPPDAARTAICKELRVNDLGEVFSWINLEKPLGSASISQVGLKSLCMSTTHIDAQETA